MAVDDSSNIFYFRTKISGNDRVALFGIKHYQDHIVRVLMLL